LALISALRDTDRRRETELDLQIALGQALIMHRSWGAPELEEANARARELATALDRPGALSSALVGRFWDHWSRADLRRARGVAEEMRELGDATGNIPMQVWGCDSDGITCFNLGEFVSGRAYLERALSLYDPAHRPSYSDFPTDTQVILRVHFSFL